MNHNWSYGLCLCYIIKIQMLGSQSALTTARSLQLPSPPHTYLTPISALWQPCILPVGQNCAALVWLAMLWEATTSPAQSQPQLPLRPLLPWALQPQFTFAISLLQLLIKPCLTQPSQACLVSSRSKKMVKVSWSSKAQSSRGLRVQSGQDIFGWDWAGTAAASPGCRAFKRQRRKK